MQWTKQVMKQVLPNGLTVLAQRDASAPVVAVVTHVKAGYFDEPDEWTGIAHVLEHMYFKGTPRRAPGQIARETQLAGGYINAATIYDKTVYHTVLPSADGGLAKALDVQADALINAALDPAELARELKVIVEEAKRKLDTPPAVAMETLYRVLFTVHRMRRWRIGTEEQLLHLSAEDVRTYYRTRYTPDRVIIGIAGDVDTDRAVRMAVETYGAWDRCATEVPGSPPEPYGGRPEARVLHGDVARPMAVFGWKTVGALHADTPALDVAAAVLGSGRGARLYRALRAPGIASGASAYHYTPSDVGVFAVSLESETNRVDEALDLATQLVDRLARDGPTEGELSRVRALLATQWARRFESADGRAAVLCEAEALGDHRLADHLYRRTMAVGVRDVQRVARCYLDIAMAGAVLYLPHGTSSVWGDGGWPTALARAPDGDASAAARAPPNVGSEEATPPVAGRHAAAGVRRFRGEVAQRQLPGVDFVVRPKQGARLVSVGVHIPGLRTAETADTAGISWLLARSALRGAGGLTAERLAEAAEALGGPIVPSASADALGWWVTVQPKALRQAAALLRRVALHPHLDDGEVAVERDLLASDGRNLRDDMFRYPVQQVRREAFADHAYGLPALGVPDTVERLSIECVRDWAERIHRQRAVVVAVGDLSVTELLEGVAPLGEWPADALDIAPLAAPRWGNGRGAEDRQKAQTALAMAFSAASYGSPDRYVISVLCSLLSGLAGRLFDELRERRSLAYTVAAMPWLAARAGAVITYIATSPEREAEAREVMVAELERVSREPLARVELERARRYAAGAVEVRRQSGQAVAEELLAAWLYDTMEELADTPDRLRSVTAEQVQRVASEVFRESGRAEYVVRGQRRPGG